MNDHTLTIILRLLHIVFGALWAGTAIFLALFMVPTIRSLGPDGGKVMQELMHRRKLPIYLMLSAIVTIVSGTVMFWRFDASTGHAFARSTPGRVFSLGGALAFIALLIGMFVNRPTAARIQQTGAAIAQSDGPPTAEQRDEMMRLQTKLVRATQTVAWLVFGAAACMAVARYT
jgi:uncharacterized membrane protein